MRHEVSIRSALFALSLALFALLVLPRLTSYGMSLDGLHFASVARNMAEGRGSLWSPHYTDTLYPFEWEHPPLSFFLQSLLFRVMGDRFGVEVIWATLCAGLILALLREFAGAQRRLPVPRARRTPGAWWVIALLICVPLVSRSFANNLIELPLLVLELGAAVLLLHALISGSAGRALFFGSAAGFALFLSVLTKAHAGLFVLVLLPLWALVNRGLRGSSAWAGCGAVVALAACVAAFAANDEAVTFARGFFEKKRAYTQAFAHRIRLRPEVIGVVVVELAPMLILAGGVLLWARRGWPKRNPTHADGVIRIATSWTQRIPPLVWVNLIAALCAIAPYLLTGMPRRYLLPALPFFAIAVASAGAAPARWLEWRLRHQSGRVLLSAGVLMLGAIGVAAFESGKIRGDVLYHEDFTRKDVRFEPRRLVQVCPASLLFDWGLHAQMQRFQRASLTIHPGRYFLTLRRAPCPPPPGCGSEKRGQTYVWFECPRESNSPRR